MKKIGLFLESNPHGGGMFQYEQAIIEAVANLPKHSFDVIIGFTSDIWLKRLRSYSFKKVYIPLGFWGRAIGRIWRISGLPIEWWRKVCPYFHPVAKKLLQQDCDLWIFPAQNAWGYQVPVPAITAVHDLMHRYEPEFPEVSAHGEWKLREQHLREICRWSEGIIVDSETGKQQVYESYMKSFEDIFILPYIPPGYILKNVSINDFEKRYSVPKKFFFYPAQFWHHKNHIRLLTAVSELKRKYPDIFLVFVGAKQNSYEDVRMHIEKLGLSDNVLIAGYVAEDDMVEFYKRARALIIPTFFGPTNIPQLEAFALGCPVATSSVYGIPEQVGDAALLFDPHSIEEIKDCMARLWNNDELCQKLSERGRKIAQKWGQPQFNKTLLSIIQKILGI